MNLVRAAVAPPRHVERFGARACIVCEKTIWRTKLELAAQAETADTLGATCGRCRAGQHVISTCGVCLEAAMLVPSSLLPHVSCKHRFCAACWVAHVALGVRERRSELRCMGERCGEKLADKDVRRLAPELHAAWTQIKFADRMEHLRNIFLAGDAFSEWAKRNTQACPRCHVLVQRSEGCNHMHCLCGHDFCYKCGKATADDCNCPYAADGPVLISGQLDVLAPLLGEAEAREGAVRTIQRAQRARSCA